MIEIRLPRTADAPGCAELAAIVIGPDRAGPFIKSHLERHHLMVAEAAKEIVGFLAYRTDWFQCTFVSLVVVRDDFRRKGIAREFFKSVEAVSSSRASSPPQGDQCSVHPHAHRAGISAQRLYRQSAPGRARAALLQAHPAAVASLILAEATGIPRDVRPPPHPHP
jgi:GNAT superfamily N-acetyltransferase